MSKFALQMIALLLTLMTIPISAFITYSVLQAIEADRLLWFLYWANIPLAMLALIVADVVKKIGDGK